MKRLLLSLLASTGFLVGGCSFTPVAEHPSLEESVRQSATAGHLSISEASVFMNNDGAFAAKLRLVKGAEKSLDLAYYIFSDDYTSSVLAQGLIDAALRGVRVRLLVDYFSAYKGLDRFSWLELQGRDNIQVRFYNRPTLEIIKDAAYLTLGCADAGARDSACDEEKVRVVDDDFKADAAGDQRISNRTFAGSGLFLSGLYGKNPKVMAHAITRGQNIDSATLVAGASSADGSRTDQLKQLVTLYFQARYRGGVEGLTARLQLAFVRLAFADEVNPVFEALNSYLPLSRQSNHQAQKDWDYLTEFLHHKFLLADRRALVLGGRNVEDAYHMQPGALSSKYTFMDTDVELQLSAQEPALADSFERLWQLRSMVASIEEVRGHAPNDLLANFPVVEAAQVACGKGNDLACVDRHVTRHFAPLATRMQAIAKDHREHLRRYVTEYRPSRGQPPLRIDDTAQISYFENLPQVGGQRSYGVLHNRESATNKNIQTVWRSALQEVCAKQTARPRDVIYHNAYLFMPANLLQEVAAVLDGSQSCGGVTLSLITNSLATTDLNIVDLLAVWQLKALADHLKDTGTATDAAIIEIL